MNTYCLLDIQTSGLYWRNSFITFLGIAVVENSFVTYQEWYPQSEEEEYDALLQFTEKMTTHSVYFTYNGTTFDVPYLSHKLRAYGITNPLSKLSHVDLLRLIFPYKQVLRLPSMKQLDLELLLGYERKSDSLKEDLMGMVELLRFMPIIRLFTDSFASINYHLQETSTQPTETNKGNSELNSSPDHTLENDAPPNLELLITATLNVPLEFPLSYKKSSYYLWGQNSQLKLKIPLYSGCLKLFFSNYRDYYYLPLEDTAIHKSIGTYVDKNHRIQAKASTCYQKVEGLFLPQPCLEIKPYCLKTLEDTTSYLLVEESWLNDTSNLIKYTQIVLQYFKQ